MKIRMKNNHDVVEDVFPDTRRIMLDSHELSNLTRGWTQRGCRDGVVKFFSDLDWEPIPEELWRDVTGECEITSENYIAHGKTSHPLTLGKRLIQTREDYRLVKRSLWVCLPDNVRQMIARSDWRETEAILKNTFAFQVERKVGA